MGVPSTLITLSVELEEKSGRRVGWLDSDRGIGSENARTQHSIHPGHVDIQEDRSSGVSG